MGEVKGELDKFDIPSITFINKKSSVPTFVHNYRIQLHYKQLHYKRF